MKALYMEKNALLQWKAKVTQMGMSLINDKNYWWIQLDETIFHPKGGGQPSDVGIIDGWPVAYVHKEVPDKSRLDLFSILHCFEEKPPFQEGDTVTLQVDGPTRFLHSRLHTAGHLVAEATHLLIPPLVGFQGNHYPQDSYVRFKMTNEIPPFDKQELQQTIQKTIQEWIEKDLPVLHQFLPNGLRSVKMTGDWAPCGGTHLSSLKEVHHVEIVDISVNQKEKKVTVKYK